jgi:hypothetical protein
MDKESKGFIKLDRNIFDHWIFQDAEKFRAFVDLIQLARWKDEKLLIGNDVITVPRGSYYTSELKLAERWRWGRDKTRSFLSLLEKEKMISKKGTRKGTMLTISNYREYQDINPTNTTTQSVVNTKFDSYSSPTPNTIKQQQTNNEPTTHPTAEQQQTNNEPDTKEEIKEVKKIKEVKEREEREEREEKVTILQPLSFPTKIHELIFNRLGEVTYRTWFIDTEIKEDEKEIVITVEDNFKKQIIESKFKDKLKILTRKDIVIKEVEHG